MSGISSKDSPRYITRMNRDSMNEGNCGYNSFSVSACPCTIQTQAVILTTPLVLSSSSLLLLFFVPSSSRLRLFVSFSSSLLFVSSSSLLRLPSPVGFMGMLRRIQPHSHLSPQRDRHPGQDDPRCYRPICCTLIGCLEVFKKVITIQNAIVRFAVRQRVIYNIQCSEVCINGTRRNEKFHTET